MTATAAANRSDRPADRPAEGWLTVLGLEETQVIRLPAVRLVRRQFVHVANVLDH